MSKSDQWANIAVVVFILVHLVILITGWINGKTSLLPASANLIAGLGIVIYWLQHELHIRQHTVETREMIVLSIEVAVIGLGAYFLLSHHPYKWLKVFHYIIFGVHLSCLVLVSIFMLTFKMNKMF